MEITQLDAENNCFAQEKTLTRKGMKRLDSLIKRALGRFGKKRTKET